MEANDSFYWSVGDAASAKRQGWLLSGSSDGEKITYIIKLAKTGFMFNSDDEAKAYVLKAVEARDPLALKAMSIMLFGKYDASKF